MGSSNCPRLIWNDDEDTDEEFVPAASASGDGFSFNTSSPPANFHSLKRSPQEMIREEAWERRQQLEQQKSELRRILRSSSDCGSQQHKLHLDGEYANVKASNRSLTEEDFEELRGCIDLGFRFGGKEDLQLCNTLPALEVCYAVNRQMEELNSDASSSSGSDESTSPPTVWTISSPGDEVHQVKEKLRHWARAVACISRQS